MRGEEKGAVTKTKLLKKWEKQFITFQRDKKIE
jgi:hypothetical protein